MRRIVRLNSVNAVADTGTTDGYDTSQSCHETGQGVAEGQHVSGVDTGQTSCFRVAAYTVDGTAQSGLGQQDVHDNVDDKYYDKGYREAGYGRRTEPHNSIITGEGYHLRVGDDQRTAPQYVLHTE